MSDKRRISEHQLIECRKTFWSGERKKLRGMLSWGEFTKMCSTADLQLSNGVMNKLFCISDKQKHGYIKFCEFLYIYFEYERKIKPCSGFEGANELSANKLQEIRKQFFDKDRKRYGKLTRREFVEMITEIGITMNNEELDKSFEIAESAKDGKIPFEEFICVFLKGIKGGDRRTAELEIIGRCFNHADHNGDGKLDRSEFRSLLKSVGIDLEPRQLSHVFRLADSDKGGTISFEEFRDVFMKSKLTLKSMNESIKSDRIQVSMLPTSQVIKIREYFSKYDVNRDGRLSWDEFLNMIEDSGMNHRTVHKAYNTMKQSRDNSISFREFLQLFPNVEELEECIQASK